MDAGQLGDDAWTSVRTLWREELWLPAGVPLAALAYALWIGLSGAAIAFLAESVGGSLTIAPWTPLTTFVAVLLACLWIVGPAAVVTILVLEHVTNTRGNLRLGYRLQHPVLLLVPPAAVLAVGYATLAAAGRAHWLPVAVLVAGATWLLIRTVAYTFRVFALSLPMVGAALLYVSGIVAAVATVLLGALAVGRESLVSAFLGGLAAETRVDWLGTLHVDTARIAGVEVAVLVYALVAVPVGLSLAYVVVQVLASLVIRAWRPTVRRPELRTGQRYPAFARPTTNAGSVRPSSARRAARPGADDGGSTEGASRTPATAPEQSTAAAEGDLEPGDGVDDGAATGDATDDVSHTRVFRPQAADDRTTELVDDDRETKLHDVARADEPTDEEPGGEPVDDRGTHSADDDRERGSAREGDADDPGSVDARAEAPAADPDDADEVAEPADADGPGEPDGDVVDEQDAPDETVADERDAPAPDVGSEADVVDETDPDRDVDADSTGGEQYCPSCGESVSDASESCPACGEALDAR